MTQARRAVHIGDTAWKHRHLTVEGGFVTLRGERFYRISNYDLMQPFFMSVVSYSDHWLFFSSNGSLTAGRKNPEHMLFPYYTVDKIHDSEGITGGQTLVLVDSDVRVQLWEPFTRHMYGLYDIRRNLYKNKCGNKLLFEETNLDLGLRFQVLWTTSDRFGFVRHSSIENVNDRDLQVRLLDGIQNIVPYGTDRLIQSERSTLLDAYRKNELLANSGLGLFLLSSIPVDKPEPSEALSATICWSVGLDRPQVLLSARQVEAFRRGDEVETEKDIRAMRGAYFLADEFSLPPSSARDWYIVADVDQGPEAVARINRYLQQTESLRADLEEDFEDGTRRLAGVVAAADGLQLTADELSMGRHFSNVLFNVMRGGTFADGYRVDRRDFSSFLGVHNRIVLQKYSHLLDALPDSLDLKTLLDVTSGSHDPDLSRLAYEYLPLSFSRRHGDPSRPWNYFSIELRAEDGSRVFNYEGNWRDIFQNWEALCVSYPGFVHSIITKFLNASTADGYNPYRITRDGIDWETIDPSDPWSYIGYWGDHQIIYLLKLLEISRRYYPGMLEGWLTSEKFVFAEVPYRIRPYESLLENPHDTIDFDNDHEAKILQRVANLGSDGRLLHNPNGKLSRANLTEKILASVLAKYSNFIPEGGIWLNTQRPEWNDANNALVGYGVSMVTLFYLRRFQAFFHELLLGVDWGEVQIAEEIAEFLAEVTHTLRTSRSMLKGGLSVVERKRVLDGLGRAGSRYRQRVYEGGFTGDKVSVPKTDLLEFVDLSLAWTDHSISSNRRDDGLYHSYNLVDFASDGIAVTRLYEMLEGQVAVLSSGLLSAEESVRVLAALRESALFRKDQYSYLLYPDRRLNRFEEKNIVPDEQVSRSKLLTRLLSDHDTTVVVRDVEGRVRFNGSFRNRHDLADALDRLASSEYADLAASERDDLLDLFEGVFDHRSYTGRSGTFFGYEGLGCIYWHMVSKLLLATAETHHQAVVEGADPSLVGKLVEQYYSIRAGIGLNKNPALYGAFPTDPYSHTPGDSGARQPGMTGQVKEDILARWFELGVIVEDGRLSFRPFLLRAVEFLDEPVSFKYYDIGLQLRTLDVAPGELAFTLCQVPVRYRTDGAQRITLSLNDGQTVEIDGGQLDRDLSREVFERTGRIAHIEVTLSPEL